MTTGERSFAAVVQAGHKERAVEVPFDPAALWALEPESFAPGRKGFGVRARIAGVTFASHVVRRSGKFWLLLPPETEAAAAIGVGDDVQVSLARPAG